MTSEFVSRVSGSNATCRPAWVTGWKATERTRMGEAEGDDRAQLVVVHPRSTAATRVTVSPAARSCPAPGPSVRAGPDRGSDGASIPPAVELQGRSTAGARPIRAPSSATKRRSVASRIPLVFSVTTLIARSGQVDEVQDLLVDRGSPPENITTSPRPRGHEGVEHHRHARRGDR